LYSFFLDESEMNLMMNGTGKGMSKINIHCKNNPVNNYLFLITQFIQHYLNQLRFSTTVEACYSELSGKTKSRSKLREFKIADCK